MENKKPKVVDKKNEEEAVPPGVVDTEFRIEELKMTGMRWSMKVQLREVLSKSYRRYTVLIKLNERPYLDRIEEKEGELDDTLLKFDKASKAAVMRDVKRMRKQLEEVRGKCLKIEFGTTVDEVKHKEGTQLLMVLPDDVIDPINLQKHNMNIYHMVLTPIV
jgi:hypothetical protein